MAANDTSGTAVARAALVLVLGTALLAAAAARADGLAFDGDLPADEHLLLDLTAEQRHAIARADARGGAPPQVTLTRAQRAQLRKAFGVAARWVFAATKASLAGECSCGAYNLGVVAGGQLAVLRRGLGDHLGERDVAAMEQLLTDRALAAREATPIVALFGWGRGEPAPEPLQGLAARLPAIGAAAAVRLPRGWTAQRLRVAGVPRLDDADRKDPAPALHALGALAGRPSQASVLQWPELGARREVGGAVLWLVPGLAVGELGPPARAWFLLEYREGRLVAAVAAAGDAMAGAVYERDGEGG